MSDHAEAAAIVEKAVKEAFPSVTTRLDVLAGSTYVDVSIPAYREEHVAILVNVEKNKPEYGFSIVDKDTGYGEGADCMFGYIPTLLKYMRRLFPLVG